jgi:hypothetical protein
MDIPKETRSHQELLALAQENLRHRFGYWAAASVVASEYTHSIQVESPDASADVAKDPIIQEQPQIRNHDKTRNPHRPSSQ